VTDLYKQYAPDKVNTVDALLKQHKGKEEELIKKIKAKYGGGGGGGGENKEAPRKEEPAKRVMPVARPKDVVWREKVLAFYEKYLPNKLKQNGGDVDIDQLLAKYKGKEQTLLDTLEKKYGGGASSSSTETPSSSSSTSSSYRDRLVDFYTKYAPDKISTVDANLAKFKGKEDQMFEALNRKYADVIKEKEQQASTTPSEPDYKARLTEFYTNYAPDKLSTVDANLAKFKGKEEQMFSALNRKYADQIAEKEKEKNKPTEKENDVASKTPAGDESNVHRQRLVDFYTQYAPDKLGGVDSTLEKCKGKEEKMFEVLEKKYAEEIRKKKRRIVVKG